MSKLSFKKFFSYILIFTIFSDSFLYCFPALFDLRFSFFVFLFVIILSLPFLKTITFSKNFLIFIFIVLGFSLINVILGNDNIFLLSKQTIGITINAFIFFFLIKLNNDDVVGVFKIYINLCFIVSLIGIVQEVGYWLRFEPFYNFRYIGFLSRWRFPTPDEGAIFFKINSIMPEPSSFCFTVMPAFFASIFSLLKRNFELVDLKRGLVIITAFLFTFSTIGYLGIILSILLIFLDYSKLRLRLLGMLLLIFLSIFCYFALPFVKYKLTPLFDYFSGNIRLEATHYTAFAFLTNALVSLSALRSSLFFGNGLGSYPISYDKFIRAITITKDPGDLLNRKDADSLLFRILAELGIWGILIFFGFIFKNFVSKRRDSTNCLWVINNGILVLFILRLIRQGHYFSEGFFFFFWVYYFTKKLASQHTHENTH